jgi:hypothetical protein
MRTGSADDDYNWYFERIDEADTDDNFCKLEWFMPVWNGSVIDREKIKDD